MNQEFLHAAASHSVRAVMRYLGTRLTGLSEAEAEAKRTKFGVNKVTREKRKSIARRLAGAFVNPFTCILFCLALVSTATDMVFPAFELFGSVKEDFDPLTVIIITTMVAISGGLRFVQELRSGNAAERLLAMITTTCTVDRKNVPRMEIPLDEVVVGDIVHLSAGDMIPADLRLIETKDLFVSQSSLTGESEPVEKTGGRCAKGESATDYANIAFMGSNVISGQATGVVVAVGDATVFGSMAAKVAGEAVETNFTKGVNSVSWVLIRFMLVMVPVVFVVNGVTKGDWLAAFLFALSVAVGLTPEMLPLVINACLVKGSHAMGRRETIVRSIRAMQELGSVDVLCVDKTGTLTGDRLVLEYYLDILGRESARTLDLAYVASTRAGEAADPFNAAILKAREMPGASAHFDALAQDAAIGPIFTGNVEDVLRLCRLADLKGELLPIVGTRDVRSVVDELSEDGMRVQAVAYLKGETYVLAGYLAFFDAPKKSARAALDKLRRLNVATKVLTGDNRLTTASICRRLGLDTEHLVTGKELESLSDDVLALRVEKTQVFAELTPRQKARVVSALRENGHAVGFVGDGLNDLPALLAASVAISVDTATEEAKCLSDVILLRKDLEVLEAGILEGRRAFHNMSKYIRIAAASNFGNICSIVVASAFLPFFPMTAAQILALNLLYDFLCFILPWDHVDPELTARPLAWSGHSLARFMRYFGPVSTLFDLFAFAFLYFFFCPATCGGDYGMLDAAGKADFAASFQTGWFLVSLWSQILILHLLRTPKISFVQSAASRPVMGATVLGLAVFSFLPVTPLGSFLGLAPLSASFAAFLFGDVVLYMGVTSFVKSHYLRRFGSLT